MGLHPQFGLQALHQVSVSGSPAPNSLALLQRGSSGDLWEGSGANSPCTAHRTEKTIGATVGAELKAIRTPA